MTIYDFEGKKQSSHQEIMPTDKRAVTGDNEVLTAEQHRAYFKDKDYSNASLTATNNSDGCVSKLTPKKGDSITVPQPEDNGDSSYDSEAPECPSGAATSENGDVVKLATWKRGDTNEIQMLMNVKTGKEITFSGIDWKSGDSLIVASPTSSSATTRMTERSPASSPPPETTPDRCMPLQPGTSRWLGAGIRSPTASIRVRAPTT